MIVPALCVVTRLPMLRVDFQTRSVAGGFTTRSVGTITTQLTHETHNARPQITIKRGTSLAHTDRNPGAGDHRHADPQTLFHHGAAVHHRGDQLPRPQQPVHRRARTDQRAGHRSGARRPDLLRVRLDLRRHAAARRLAGGSRAAADPLHRGAGAVVHCDHFSRLRWQLHRPVRPAYGRRCAGGPGVPDQQPRRHRLVPGKGTRHRRRLLYLRPVRRPGVSDPGARLAADPLWLAHGVRRHRRRRCALGGDLVHGLPRTP